MIKVTQAQKDLLYAKYGLDKPLLTRFFLYCKNMLKGDLGVSYAINKNFAVSGMVKDRLGISIAVGAMAMTIGTIAGLLLGILAGIIYAVYNVSTKLALGRGMHPVTLTMYAFMFMTLFALPMSDPLGIASNVAASPYSALLLVGLGIFTFVMPYFLYTLGMRSLSAPVATALGTVEPMAATLFDVCIFHTALEPLTVCGIVLIIAAVVILALTERKDRPNEA